MALSLTIAGVNKISALRKGTLKIKTTNDGSQGILDCTLYDFKPADNDTIVVADGATTYYSGHVRSISLTELKKGHYEAKISGQDDSVAGGAPTTAAFNISDTPNNTTTFPYIDLEYNVESERGASYVSTKTTGSFKTYKPGLVVNTNIQVTSANFGLSASTFTITELEISWDDVASLPLYSVTFGDVPIRLVDTIISGVIGEAQDPASDLAQALHAPHVVTSLPSLPDTAYPVGDLAYLTTDGKVYRNVNDVWTSQIDGADILVSSITAGAIQAGAIGAQALAAEIVISSVMKTATTGNRVEFDQNGIRAYDANSDLLVNVPTYDAPVYVKANIDAGGLNVANDARFATSAHLSQGAQFLLDAGISTPTLAPGLTISYEAMSLTAPSITNYTTFGGYYDSAGGASGATACYVAVVTNTDTLVSYVYEWKLSDGSIDRITQLTGVTFNNGAFITRIGTSWYLCGKLRNGTSNVGLAKVTRSTGAMASLATVTGDFWFVSDYGWPIKTDGTNLYVAGPSSAANARIVKYNTSLAKQSTTELTDPAVTGQEYRWAFEIVGTSAWLSYETTFGSGAWKMYEFTLSTGAAVSNTQFEAVPGDNIGGFIWDGTQFRARRGNALYKHTNWTWTTASPIYWVGYSWYDSNATGGTHETSLSPRASITMKKRARLEVKVPALPGNGGTDEPNNSRVYMLPNATAPSAGSFKLQSTSTGLTHTLTTYNSGGAADGSGTAFPNANPALMTDSQTTFGEWFLYGDGFWEFNGGVGSGSTDFIGSDNTLGQPMLIVMRQTAFPASPTQYQQVYRRDLGMWFQYDGTRWLSIEEFAINLYADADIQSLTATTNHLVAPTPVVIGSDIYLTRLTCQFLVNGGTALSGSHSWISTNRKRNSANTDTAFGSAITINSGSSSVWRTSTQNINALLNAGTTYYAFAMLWTKTGTPGNLFNFPVLYYRHVAT